MRLLRYHMPHPTLGVLNIPLVAGNDMNVDMEDTLSSRWPYVNANIITIGIKLLINDFFLIINKAHASGYFFRG